MELIYQHWLSFGAGIFLIVMMLYGHYRGFLRQCVSLGALVLTLIVVKLATPYLTDFIRANPTIRENAAQMIVEASGWQAPEAAQMELPAAQRTAIEDMQLPQTIKDLLIENNNGEIYRMLGVEQFTDYVSTYLADLLINAVVTVAIFLLCFILVHLLIKCLDLVARLPIISGLNQIAGAVAGLAQGLLLLWVGGFFVSLAAATPLGQSLEAQIYASDWLTLLYRYNLINLILGGLIRGIF